MIVTDQTRTARPLRPNGGKQGRRINLEAAIGLRGDIRCRLGAFDARFVTEKQAARLAFRRRRAMIENLSVRET